MNVVIPEVESVRTPEVIPTAFPDSSANPNVPFVFGSYVLIPTGAARTSSLGLFTEVTLNTLFRSSAENPLSSITESTPLFTEVTVT